MQTTKRLEPGAESVGRRGGGTEESIRHHYDVGNDFYRLWLDDSVTYSCALWDETIEDDDLEAAQRRKLDYHVRTARVAEGHTVLDIGCGWGSLLRALVSDHGVTRAVGLTLSDAQATHIGSLGLPHTEVRKESWIDHEPLSRYDAIISLGAFEHFASPSYSRSTKIGTYREFFERCHDWLGPDGRLSLQTIAYGTMRPEDANPFMNTEIFPDSELPCLDEIVSASQETFELVSLRNDRGDYARTCDHWLRRLRARREEAVRLVGEDVVERYERYLKFAIVGFRMGKCVLLRVAFRRLSRKGASRAGC